MKYDLIEGDCLDSLRAMPDKSVQCCVTSPPYFGLRDYGSDGQIGLESTPEEFIGKLVEVFREVRRVLKDDGTFWLNIGDSYASYRDGKATPDTTRGDSKGTLVPKGSARNRMAATFSGSGVKHKDLIGIPWMLAFALRADGWYLRQDIIWHKPNPMPESVRDRCTKAHEYIFLLSKGPKYYYDVEAVKQDAKYPNDKRRPLGSEGAWKIDGRKRGENGGGKSYDHDTTKRNRRSVWTVTTKPFKGAHFATFPPDLIEPCILAGSRPGDTVLDPFNGAGTTGLVSLTHGRNYIGCELNSDYCTLTRSRLDPVMTKHQVDLFNV